MSRDQGQSLLKRHFPSPRIRVHSSVASGWVPNTRSSTILGSYSNLTVFQICNVAIMSPVSHTTSTLTPFPVSTQSTQKSILGKHLGTSGSSSRDPLQPSPAKCRLIKALIDRADGISCGECRTSLICRWDPASTNHPQPVR